MNKLTVLHQLSQEAEPISLRDLLGKLGGGYAERTVRRWLSEMIVEGVVEQIGLKRATKYRVIHRAGRQDGALGHCFRPESEVIIAQLRRPLYERMPVTYADDWFHSYRPNDSFYIPLDLRLKLYMAGKRSKNGDPAGTYANQIFDRLLIDLSYNSSRLEGNTYSLLDTQKLLLEGSAAEGKLDEEKVMILNHKEAIRYLVSSARKPEITEQTIYTLHYLLADGLVEPQYAGKVRDHGVRIGGSAYIPFEDPRQLQAHLQQIVEKGASIVDPYEQSFFFLVHLSYLQAFTDVNKRIARIASNIPLIRENLVPLSFNDVSREDYTSAIIAIYELQDVRPLLDLYLFSYMRTCAMYDATVKALGFDEVRVRYRQERRGVLAEIIRKKLPESELQEFALKEAHRLIPAEDQERFIEDLWEDLRELDENRIVGLGITPRELREWFTDRQK